jgi:hypothetical protein
MGVTYNNTSTVTDGLLYGVDFANTKSYSGSGTIFTDYTAGRIANLSNPSYYSYDSATRSMNFTRDNSTITGGYTGFTGTGNLTSTNFLYRDHSVEILFRVNDVSPGNYNVNEQTSVLCGYQGYHSGFAYNADGGLFYTLWNNNGYNQISSPVGLIVVGTWMHAVLTRLNNVVTMYINGVSIATATISTPGGNPGITDNYRLAAGNASVGPFAYYAKCNIAVNRLYGKALSQAEVLQNFNAVRGRYGL